MADFCINERKLAFQLRKFIDRNWESMLDEVAALVAIPSYAEPEKAAPGAPFGPGPARALDYVLKLAYKFGMEPHNCNGYIGYADLYGAQAEDSFHTKEVGIIAHLDVVPAGSGWDFPPYEMTRKEGYLVGRGVADDKGPLVMALFAMKFWREFTPTLPFRTRFIFGCDEETKMRDVDYYRKRFSDPLFLFTPDAAFPVAYGEAGILSASFALPAQTGSVVQSIEAGVASNAVPASACARVLDLGQEFEAAEGISVTRDGGCFLIQAQGKSAHASQPEQGVNALGILVRYLLDNEVGSKAESAFFELIEKLTESTDGAAVGIAASDESFGSLVSSATLLRKEDNALKAYVDVRYPSSTNAEAISKTFEALAEKFGAHFTLEQNRNPYRIDPDSPYVKALNDAYKKAAELEDTPKPFTIKGGTYARKFPRAVSFGAEVEGEALPEWAGTMHGANEAISEESLKRAFKAYVYGLCNLGSVV